MYGEMFNDLLNKVKNITIGWLIITVILFILVIYLGYKYITNSTNEEGFTGGAPTAETSDCGCN